jgi:phthiocerol/phenolphthiocerol synthesis type-I polyketide synthase E
LTASRPPGGQEAEGDDGGSEFGAVMAAQLELPADEFDERIALSVFQDNRRAPAEFQPGQFTGDILLLRAAAASDDEDREVWRSHVSGRIKPEYLGCGHYEMLDPGPAVTIGEILSEELRHC